MRDYQRKTVYTAEKQWDDPLAQQTEEWLEQNLYRYEYPYENSLAVQRVLPFYEALDVVEVETLVYDISDSWDISCPRINFQDNKPKVALAHMDDIDLPEWAMNITVVCHEMAHVITQQRCVFDAHGPVFCGVFVELVHEFMGVENGRDLQWAFELNSVDVEYNTI